VGEDGEGGRVRSEVGVDVEIDIGEGARHVEFLRSGRKGCGNVNRARRMLCMRQSERHQ